VCVKKTHSAQGKKTSAAADDKTANTLSPSVFCIKIDQPKAKIARAAAG